METVPNDQCIKEIKANRVWESVKKTGSLVFEIVIFPVEIVGSVSMMVFSEKYKDEDIDKWLTNKFFKNREKD